MHTLVSDLHATVDIRVYLAAFGSANAFGKNALLRMYIEFLKSKPPQSGFSILWRNAEVIHSNIGLLAEYEAFTRGLFCQDSSTSASPGSGLSSHLNRTFRSCLSKIDACATVGSRTQAAIALIACDVLVDYAFLIPDQSLLNELVSRALKVRTFTASVSSTREFLTL